MIFIKMRIADRIALRILEEIEVSTGRNFTKKQYLSLECMTANILKEEINKWLSWDTDLNTFE